MLRRQQPGDSVAFDAFRSVEQHRVALGRTAGAAHAIRRETAELLSDHDNHQLNWQPDPGGWSVAQCLQHVTMVTRSLIPAVERMIDEARKRQLAGLPAYRRSLLLAFVTGGLEPPPPWRVRTSRELEPGVEFDRPPACGIPGRAG